MAQMRTQKRIPVSLLRHYRTVLSRKSDSSGKPLWVATVVGLPGCRATGSSRIEALDRVREMAERRSDDGGLRRRFPAPDEVTADAEASGRELPRMSALEGRDADRVT